VRHVGRESTGPDISPVESVEYERKEPPYTTRGIITSPSSERPGVVAWSLSGSPNGMLSRTRRTEGPAHEVDNVSSPADCRFVNPAWGR
jgi:hypothetical protein